MIMNIFTGQKVIWKYNRHFIFKNDNGIYEQDKVTDSYVARGAVVYYSFCAGSVYTILQWFILYNT